MKKFFSLFLAILTLSLALCGCGESAVKNGWGNGLTKDIPEFDHQLESFTQAENGGYAAAYYKNVSGEEIAQYISALAESGIVLESGVYPASAILEDKIITVHYNVTEMLFSVTVTKIEK